MKDQLPPLDPLQRYTLEEAAQYLRLSRSRMYLDMKSGKLPVINDGRRRFVSGTVIAARSRIE